MAFAAPVAALDTQVQTWFGFSRQSFLFRWNGRVRRVDGATGVIPLCGKRDRAQGTCGGRRGRLTCSNGGGDNGPQSATLMVQPAWRSLTTAPADRRLAGHVVVVCLCLRASYTNTTVAANTADRASVNGDVDGYRLSHQRGWNSTGSSVCRANAIWRRHCSGNGLP